MRCTPTPNEFLAEAQARQLSREVGTAYLVKNKVGYFLATVGVMSHETVLIKFENGKQVSL